jgi:hypothetical protein
MTWSLIWIKRSADSKSAAQHLCFSNTGLQTGAQSVHSRKPFKRLPLQIHRESPA